jgi:hypothetical protein
MFCSLFDFCLRHCFLFDYWLRNTNMVCRMAGEGNEKESNFDNKHVTVPCHYG